MFILYIALLISVANAYSIDWAGPYWTYNYWGEYWAVKQYGTPGNTEPTKSGEPVYTYVCTPWAVWPSNRRSNYRREIYLGAWGMNGTERTTCDGLVTDIYVVTKGSVPMCLDSGLGESVAGSGILTTEPTAGRALKVWECLGDVYQQKWVWTKYGTGDEANSTFTLHGKDLCIAFGNPLKLAPCNVTDVQQLWKVYGQQPYSTS